MASPAAVVPVTWRPMSAAPAASCDALSIDVIWLSRSLIFWTMLNCAVCARYWLGSAGLSGSWYLSSATSSLRNVFGSVRLSVPVDAAGAEVAGGVALTGLIELMVTSEVEVDAAAGGRRRVGGDGHSRRRLGRQGRGGRSGLVRGSGARPAGADVERAELQAGTGEGG